MPPTNGWNIAARSTRFLHHRPTRPRHSLLCTWGMASSWIGSWCLLLSCLQALSLVTPPLHAADSSASQAEGLVQSFAGGPFPVRSLSPVQLLYFQFIPERAVPLPHQTWSIRFDLVQANYLARDEHGDDFFLFDYELTRANLALQYGVLDNLTVGLEIPLLYTWKGFLDEPINGFEDLTGFERTIRFERPQHLFSIQMTKDGREALRGTSGAVGIGDIAFSTKTLLREEGSLAPAVAGRFALKLPTGNEDRAMGSGAVDIGL
jgi:hypothetical protein